MYSQNVGFTSFPFLQKQSNARRSMKSSLKDCNCIGILSSPSSHKPIKAIFFVGLSSNSKWNCHYYGAAIFANMAREGIK